MSKSRATDTHLTSEKKARRRFLSLYLILVFLLVGLLGYFYYRSQEQLMFSQQRIRMMGYASEQTRKLKQLHRHYPQERQYPRDSRFRSAIYDLEYQKIFSTLENGQVDLDAVIYQTGESIHLVKMLDDYYLGAKYLVIEVPQQRRWYRAILTKIALYALFSLLFLALFGYYLSRLFVRPMQDSILLLDRFIKDTTHELNTPLSAMLANIEMMDRKRICESNAKKLNRIEIAARTVSTLYEDLKFLTLERSRKVEDASLDMLPIIESRLEYFSLQMRAKKLTLETTLTAVQVTADRRLIIRLIDNLLSNAIKYNVRGGSIEVVLDGEKLIIRDSGIGIPSQQLTRIFERYSRFNESEGGFGIGLNIVKKIADQYGMVLEVMSEPQQGTTMILYWKKEPQDATQEKQ